MKSPNLNIDVVLSAVQRDDNIGFCLGCGLEQGGCEPDAREYKCDSCGEFSVYGAEEILMMEIE